MRPVLVVAIGLLAVVCDGARILGLMPFNAKSHWIVMEPLFQELATRGHQLSVYSAFPQRQPLANYTDVDLSARLPPIISARSIDYIKDMMATPWKTTFYLHHLHHNTCNIIELPAFQKLLTAKGEYDLVITETFATDCFNYFAHKLNVPLISITSSMMMPWAADKVGVPDNPSYIPSYLVNFTPQMTLWERVYNSIVLLYAKFWHLYVFSKRTQVIAEKGFREPLPPVHELVANTSLLFVNSYHTLSQSRPFPPNVIEVGGIHIKKKQPLPEDLKNILERAKSGAIIMSFGSVVRSSTIPKSTIMGFMNAFAKIPQTIIFKFEEDLPEKPSNVIIRKWLPQRDLIDHENVIALIIHGGLASTIEAVHFGKPIIGIPFFADQYVNIKAIVSRGAGVHLDIDDISKDKVANALSEILYNPKYTENMKQLSQQFRDRPMTPLQTAVYWTEYVIRHQGAPHLRPASVGLPFYQYLLLDVIAVLLGSITVILYAFYVIFKWILSFISLCRVVSKKDYNSKKTN